MDDEQLVSQEDFCSMELANQLMFGDRASLVQRCKQPTRCNNFFVY